jgi:hypothetical protein
LLELKENKYNKDREKRSGIIRGRPWRGRREKAAMAGLYKKIIPRDRTRFPDAPVDYAGWSPPWSSGLIPKGIIRATTLSARTY